MTTGYKLGYYKLPNDSIKEVLIHVELIDSSKLVDERQHEIYDFLKTDVSKITKIESLYGEQKIDDTIPIYIVKTPNLKYDVKEGELIRFKHSEFREIIPDFSYIAFYTTKTGALNNSIEVPKEYTGIQMYYYPNGRIKEKHYYVNGYKTHTFGYYNTEFNSLHYTWVAEQKNSNIREYIYNLQENPVAQYIIANDVIINKTIYDRSDYFNSIYLDKISASKNPLSPFIHVIKKP